MFPLGGVLLPGEALPLHVFEPRYRQLVDDLLAGTPELGVILIERGSEVGGGDVRFDVGCLARLAEAVRLPDDRWALLLEGVDRIRVAQWLPDDPYPLAEVEPWPDEGAEDPLRTAELLAEVRRLIAMAIDAGHRIPVPPDEVESAWRLCSLAPIGPLDRLSCLRAPGPAERLDRLAGALADVEAVLAAGLGGG